MNKRSLSDIIKKTGTLITLILLCSFLWVIPSLASESEGNDGVEALTGTGSITTDALNVRSGPGQEYDKIGGVKKGDQLIITGRAPNGWYRIDLNGESGFISGNYVEADIIESLPEEDGGDDIIGEPEEGYRGTHISPSMLRIAIAAMAIIVIVLLMIVTLKKILLPGEDDEDDDEIVEGAVYIDSYDEEEEIYEEDGPYEEDGEYYEDGEEPYEGDDEEYYEDGEEVYEEDAPYEDGEYYEEEGAYEEPSHNNGQEPKSYVIREEDYRVNVDPSFFDDKEPIEQPEAVTGYLERQKILEAEKAAAEKSGDSEEIKQARIDEAMRKLDELKEELKKLQS